MERPKTEYTQQKIKDVLSFLEKMGVSEKLDAMGIELLEKELQQLGKAAISDYRKQMGDLSCELDQELSYNVVK